MRVLARVMGLSVMFILTSIIFLQLSSFNIHEMELSDATTTAMTSTQIVEQENIEDDIYDTTNARKVIDSNTKYQQQYVDDFAMLVGAKSTSVTTRDGETSATLYAGLRNKHDLNTLPNAMSYTNQTAELTENVAKNTVGGTRSTYKITFMETDWETGILSVKVQSTYAMLNGEYKTIETYKTNIIENNGVDTIKRFNIFFNANGGVCNESVRSVQKWKKYGELPIPQRNHYTFLGWYTELNGGTKVDANTIMGNGDVTLYAHWEANPFKNTIKHYVMDGDKKLYLFDTTNYTRRYEEKYQLSASEQGLTVPKGLALNTYGTTHVTGSAKEYPFGTQVTQKAEDMEYEFYYKTIDYKVTYNLNGGTNANGNKSSYNVLHGFNLETPTKRGYTFLGWYDENGQRVATLNGSIDNDFKNKDDMYNKLNTRTVGNKVLTARWKANEYTITYDGNGATSGSMSGNVATYDSAYAIQENQYVRKGYTFIGWTTKADGTSDGYDWTSYTKDAQWNGDGFSDKLTNYNVSYWSGTWKFIDGQYGIQNGKMQLYAMWQVNQYKIDLNCILDGEESYWSHAYGTVDIYVNGKIARDDVSDAGVTLNYGDTWELKDIKATKGHYYVKTTYSEYGVNGKKVGTSGTIGEHGISLFPEWNTKVLGIHYHRNYSASDTTTANQSAKYGVDGQKLDANPWERTGYAFLGWSTDKNATKAEYSNKQSISNDWIDTKYPNIHLYAVWKPYTLTVRYHNDGAQKWISHANGDVEINVEGKDVVETETVKYDEDYAHWEVGLLDVNRFTRKGYHDSGNWKIGWSTSPNKVKDAGGTLPNSKGQGLATYLGVINAFEKGDVTVDLYPEWIANTYTVKYNGNGENSGTTPSSSHTYDTAKNLTANEYVKNGYQFVGWNTQADGSGTSYSDKQSVKNLTATNGGTVTLYAQWKPYTLTIRYHGDGALKDGSTNVSGKDVLLEEKVAYNGSYTHLKDATKLSKDGYTPNNGNWIVGENGPTVVSSSKSLANGETVGIYLGCISSFHKSNVTVDLYPEWIANTWTVKYDANGGNGSMENTTHVWDGGIKVRKNTFEKPLYTFRGWNLSHVNNGKTEWLYAKSDNSWAGAGSWYESGKQPSGYVKYQLADEQVLQACTLIKNDVITAHAQWTPNTYYVTYDANGGSGAPAQQAFVADSGTKLSTTKPTRTGYTFVNWVYEGTTFNPGDAIPTGWGNFTLKAQWSPYVHTVTYNANGGSGAPENQTKTYGVAMSISSTKPTRFGYTFTGWKDSRTGKIWQPGENYTPDYNGGTNTLTAQWKEAVSYLESGSEFNKHIPSTTTIVEFTDEKAPSGVALTDVSNAKDESVVAWTVPNTTTWKVSSQIPNRKIYFNENCQGMFRDKTNTENINFGSYVDTSKVVTMENMFNNAGSKLSVLDLTTFDTSNVTNMRGMFSFFYKPTSLIEIKGIESFNTSKVKNMSSLFMSCVNLTSLNLSKWDTSQVTTLNDMFYACHSLVDLNVSGWNTSNVTDTFGTFFDCGKIKKLDVSSWDTSKVVSVSDMFYGCGALQQLDVSNWNTSNVTDMMGTFWGCGSLTSLDLSKWNTNKVTNMGNMFSNCSELTDLNIEKFNTSRVTNIENMFSHCGLKKIDLSNWDTSNVTNMAGLFSYTDKLEEINVENLNLTNVKNISSMFYRTRGLKTIIGISEWDTSNVTNMVGTFQETHLQDLDISGWNNSNVKNSRNMFYVSRLEKISVGTNFTFEKKSDWGDGLTAYNTGYFNNNEWYNLQTGQKYLTYEIPSNTAATYVIKSRWMSSQNMLEAGPLFNEHIPTNATQVLFTDEKAPNGVTTLDVSHNKSNGIVGWLDGTTWKISTQQAGEKVVFNLDSFGMFKGNKRLVSVNFNQFVNSDYIENIDGMFNGASNITNIYGLNGFNIVNLTSLNDVFSGCNSLVEVDISNWDTSNIKTMRGTFYECKALPIIDVSNWNTSNVTDMFCTFYGCYSVESLDVSKWNTSNVTNMQAMFSMCKKIKTLDLHNFNTSKVTDIAAMFHDTKNLVEIKGLSDLDVSNVTVMNMLFQNATSIVDIDLSKWNTSKVTNMKNMFVSTFGLKTLNLGGTFSTENVTVDGMDNMFGNPYENIDIGNSQSYNGTNPIHLEKITLSNKFAWKNKNGYLHKPNRVYIDGADGKWYNEATGIGYAPEDIPSEVAATYMSKK